MVFHQARGLGRVCHAVRHWNATIFQLFSCLFLEYASAADGSFARIVVDTECEVAAVACRYLICPGSEKLAAACSTVRSSVARRSVCMSTTMLESGSLKGASRYMIISCARCSIDGDLRLQPSTKPCSQTVTSVSISAPPPLHAPCSCHNLDTNPYIASGLRIAVAGPSHTPQQVRRQTATGNRVLQRVAWLPVTQQGYNLNALGDKDVEAHRWWPMPGQDQR
jgi:hypothetical protein